MNITDKLSIYSTSRYYEVHI